MSGKYKLFYGSKIFIYNDTVGLEQLNLNLKKIGLSEVKRTSIYNHLKKFFLKLIQNIIISKFYLENKDDNKLRYKIFIFGENDNKFVKFFDFNNNYTFTRFLITYNNRIFDFIRLIVNYPESLIFEVDFESKTFKEKILINSSIDFEKMQDKSFVCLLFQKIYNYSLRINRAQVSLNNNIRLFNELSGNDKVYINSICHFQISTYNEIVKSKYPVILQHGDLITNNVLFSNNKIHVIDYEHSKDLFFFYDFIFFVISYKWMRDNDNDILIECFLGQSFDNLLYELFEAHDLDLTINRNFKIHLIILTMVMRRIFIDKIEQIDKHNVLESVIARDLSFLNQVIIMSE